ncbi:uncharacterized protein LOC111884955 [Lactuca sativa]|uniref:Uncharacterized protein n=1 Tax=Lactuca sativa TaxID=4236 RepID=A0A9R1X5A2_LACSA|nr:uncharacterized protein LOC111884955 [Lactuca sativa]KAJ0198334.1 hypothetical protein LSAT_V11C700385580 [Lactuca sativa]
MAFTVIPNLSPPTFTRLHLHQSSQKPPSSSSSHSATHHNYNGVSVQSSVETPPVRVRVTPPSDPRQDFYVNLGLAVRTLRHDLPLLFSTDLNYEIYRDDITFVDPLNKFTGIENYKLIFRALRFHGRILFKDISLEIFRVWQPSENLILIRWNLKGTPRVPWEAKGEFQGTSRYKLDRNGKIYEHKVDNLAFNFPKQLKPATSVLDFVSVCPPATPNPTFSWATTTLDSTYSSSSWLDFYRAVKNTLDPSYTYDYDYSGLLDYQLVATCL